MVKGILVKRQNKSTTAEQFWQDREKLKTKVITKKQNRNVDISDRHRFKTMTKQRQQVNISILDSFDILKQQFSVGPNVQGSYLLDQLEHFRLTIRNQTYNEFYEEVVDYSMTLALLLNSKKFIFDKINEYLCKAECNLYIVQLIPAVIRDLQSDCFQEFMQVFETLIHIIDVDNLELIEKIYQAIAYGFKYLFKLILQNKQKVIQLYHQQLFGNKSAHIRKFSSESFSYLLKQMDEENRQETLYILLNETKENEEFSLILSQIMYYTMKGVGKYLSHKSLSIFKQFLNQIIDKPSYYDSLRKIFYEIIKNTTTKQNEDKVAFTVLDLLLIVENQENQTQEFQEISLQMFADLINYHQGIRINEEVISSLLNFYNRIFERNQQSKRVYNKLSILLGQILKTIQTSFEQRQSQIYQYQQQIESSALFQNFILKLDVSNFKQLICQLIVPQQKFVFEQKLNKNQEEEIYNMDIDQWTFNTIQVMIFKTLKQVNQSNCQDQIDSISIFLTLAKFNDKTALQLKDNQEVKNFIESIIKQESKENYVIALRLAQYLNIKINLAMDIDFNSLECLENESTYQVFTPTLNQSMAFEKISTFINFCDDQQQIQNLFTTMLSQVRFHSIPLFLEILKNLSKKLSTQFKESNQNLIKPFITQLNNPFSIIRKHKLYILREFLPHYDHILGQLINIEDIPVNLDNERQIKSIISQLQNLIYHNQFDKEIDPYIFKQILAYFLLGFSYVRFQLIWETIAQCLIIILGSLNKEKQAQEYVLFNDYLSLLIKYDNRSVSINKKIEKKDLILRHYLNFNDDTIEQELVYNTYFKVLTDSERVSQKFQVILMQQFRAYIEYQNQKNLEKLNGKQEQEFVFQEENQSFESSRLQNYLKLYNNFSIQEHNFNEELYRFLRINNEKIQLLSLQCICKNKKIKPYLNHLKSFIQRKTFKSAVVQFKQSDIDQEQRDEVSKIIICALYPILFNKRALKHYSDIVQNRKIIFNYLSTFDQKHIRYLMELIYHTYGIDQNKIHKNLENLKKRDVPQQNLNMLQGFIWTFGNFIQGVHTMLAPHIEEILEITLLIINYCQFLKVSSQKSTKLKDVNKQAVLLYLDINRQVTFSINCQEQLLQSGQIFVEIYNHKVKQLKNQCNNKGVPGILKVIKYWSEDLEMFSPLIVNTLDISQSLIIHVIEIYSQSKANETTLKIVHEIIIKVFNIQSSFDNQIEEEDLFQISLNEQQLQQICQLVITNIIICIKSTISSKQLQSKQNQAFKKGNMLNINSLEICEFFIQKVQSLDLQLIQQYEDLFSEYLDIKIFKHQSNSSKSGVIIDLILRIYTTISRLNPNEIQFKKLQNIIGFTQTQTQKELVFKSLANIIQIPQSFQDIISLSIQYDNLNQQPITQKLIEGNDQFLDILENEDQITIENQKIYQLYLLNLISYIEDQEFVIRNAVTNSMYVYFQLIMKNQFDEEQTQLFKNFLYGQVLSKLRIGIKSSINQEGAFKSYVMLYKLYLDLASKTSYKHSNDLTSLKNLRHSDPNQDFFNLIHDMALSKRIQALKSLKNYLSQKNEDTDHQYTLEAIIIPILENQVFQKAQEIKKNKNKQKVTDQTQYMVQQIVNLCGEISCEIFKHIQDSLKKKILKRYINYICNKKEDQENVKLEEFVVKFLVNMLEGLNPNGITIFQQVENQMEQNNQDQLQDLMNHNENKQLEEYKIEDNFQGFLLGNVLGPLKSILYEGKTKTHKKEKQSLSNTHSLLTIAIIKLVSKLSQDVFKIEFPKVISFLADKLKDKDNDKRKQIRKILCDISTMSGPYFLHYILKELKQKLVLGWQKHILNYTVFTIIQSFDIKKLKGRLDYCFQIVYPLFFEELFGQLRSEKEDLDLGKRIPELTKQKAFEVIQILSEQMNFKNTIVSLVGFIRDQMNQYLTSYSNLSKFELIGQNIIKGLEKNDTLQLEELTKISFTLIQDSEQLIEQCNSKEYKYENTIQEEDFDLRAYDNERKYAIQDETARNESIFKKIQKDKEKNTFKTSHILQQFGLNFIVLGLKRKIIISNNANSENFNALLQKVIVCLGSQENNVITPTLKIFSYLIEWQIDIIQKKKKKIFKSLMRIIEQLTSSDVQLLQQVFRILKVMMQGECKSLISAHQLNKLIVSIQYFLDKLNDLAIQPLELLKIIIDQKLVDELVYDLVKNSILNQVVTSYCIQTQNICKNIIISFLANYPVSEKLLQEYVHFFIKNTKYEGREGRVQVYNILLQIVKIFPEEILKSYFELIYLKFVVNKVDIGIQGQQEVDLIDETIQEILQKINNDLRQKLLINSLQWIQQQQKFKVQQAGYISLQYLCQKSVEQNIVQEFKKTVECSKEELQQYRERLQEQKENKQLLQETEWQAEDNENLNFNQEIQYTQILKLQLNVLKDIQNIDSIEQQLLELANYPDEAVSNLCIEILNKQESLNISETQEKHILNYLLVSRINKNDDISEKNSGQKLACKILYQNNLVIKQIKHSFTIAIKKFQQNINIVKNILEILVIFLSLEEFNQDISEDLSKQIIYIAYKTQVVYKDYTDIDELIQGIQVQLQELLGQKQFLTFQTQIQTQIQQLKQQRQQDEQNQAILNPEEYAKKKILKNQKKRELEKRKKKEIRQNHGVSKHKIQKI